MNYYKSKYMQKPLETKEKKTKSQLDAELLATVHTLLPDEEIKIMKDAKGTPGRIVIIARRSIFLDYEEKE